MPKITLQPLDDGQKSVEIPIGKTTIGRGPFLGCGDKKVSRNHAVLEVTEQGEVFLTPTHVNPCFFQPTADSPGTILKKDKPHKLEHGDSFSLLPRAFRYEVVMVEEVTSTSTENENEGTDAKTEEKVNGTSEEKERCRDENRDSKGDSKSEQEEETLSTNCQQNSKDALLPEAEDSSQNKEEEEGEDEEEEEEEEEEEDDEEEPPKEKKPTPLNIERKPDVEFNGDDVKEPTKEQIPADVKPELPKVESDAKKKEPTDCKEEEEEEDQEAGGSDARTERTLPDWMVELSSPQKGQKKVLKTAKQHRREKTPGKRKKDVEEKPRRKKKELERVSEDEVVNVRVSSSQRPSSGRSSRTNRQTRQGLSLDDFVASDDDEEWPSDESEPRLKKKRRSRRKDDDSGSDWEIEHKRAKRVSHKFSSGSESGSDWRTNSPRKKKAPRGRRRRSKRTKEEEVISDDDDDEKSQSGKQSKRTPCSFGKKCFRKNAGHLDQFSHPGDSDFESEAEEKQNDLSESGEESDNLKECPFGVNCYRKNPQHKKEFKHTKKVRPQREAAKHSDKKSKGSDENNEPDAYDLNDSFLNDESDEYKPVDSGSEYESNHDVKRLPTKATTKRVTKNKRAKRV